VKRNLPILCVLLLLAGCQSTLVLMPTPEVLKDERFNLFEANPEPMTSNELGTLYVTTRVADPNRSDFFRSKPDDALHFGYSELRIGPENLNLLELIQQSTTGDRREKFSWHMLSAPILGSTRRPEPDRFDGSILPEDMEAFMDALNAYIDENPVKELTIYIHGANNTFYWSVAQGAQFQFFTGDNAMVLTFAWPSPGNIWSYGRDKRQADAAAIDLAYLIELLAHHCVATRINLLAYSAGGRVVGGALEALARRYSDQEELRIGQVYLTQSDQPLADFVDALPDFFPLMEGLTVTAAAGDPVLGMSRMTDLKLRLGATGEGDGENLKLSEEDWQEIVDIMNSDRMVFIDLVNVPEAQYRFTHGAWYDSAWVSTDVMATLLGGLSATERGLQAQQVNEVRVWTFPENYIERLTDFLLTRDPADRKIQPPDS
jgi:esterase/lipase superfamily enzyme